MGLIMYLLPLLGLGSYSAFHMPIPAVVAPLVLWVIKKDGSRYVDSTGKEVINFNLCVLAAFFALRVLAAIGSVIYLGWVFRWTSDILWIAWLANTLVSAYTAKDGKFYRFPFTYPLVK